MSTEENDVIDALAADAAAEEAKGSTAAGVDNEIEEMKRRVQEMEEEAAKLTEMQSQVEKQMGTAKSAMGNAPGTPTGGANAAQAALDECSIYVGQVDYEATPEELQALFQSCGTINRVTIMCNKFTGQPKGFAYIEFASPEAVESAVLLDETPFRGRQLKVTPKRENIHGFNRGRGGYRGGGRGGVGRGGGGRGGYRGGRGGYRGGGRRGRGRGYQPY